MTHTLDANTSKLQRINDTFRVDVLSRPSPNGRAVVTSAFSSLDPDIRKDALKAIYVFDNWTTEPDEIPYDEHDYGSITLDDNQYFFKIDYYSDDTCEWGSEHPTDLSQSYRILTVGLHSDY